MPLYRAATLLHGMLHALRPKMQTKELTTKEKRKNHTKPANQKRVTKKLKRRNLTAMQKDTTVLKLARKRVRMAS